MTAPAAIADPLALPPRLTDEEVLALSRYSRATLARRRKQGRFPNPVERGIWLRDDVLAALGLLPPIGNADADAFRQAADAFHHDRTARKRRTSPAR